MKKKKNRATRFVETYARWQERAWSLDGKWRLLATLARLSTETQYKLGLGACNLPDVPTRDGGSVAGDTWFSVVACSDNSLIVGLASHSGAGPLYLYAFADPEEATRFVIQWVPAFWPKRQA